jgi:membrane protein required for colicin V production
MLENFTMMDFNYFDVAIGSVVLILGIKGFLNGFIREIFGLAGLVGGMYLASRFAPLVADFIDQNFLHLQNVALLKLIGFLAILITVWLGATILGAIFAKLTSMSGLSFLDRLLGFIAGGGKYFIIFALIVTALSNVTVVKDNLNKYVKDSILYPILVKTGSTIIRIDPTTIGIKPDVKIDTIDTNATNTTQTQGE